MLCYTLNDSGRHHLVENVQKRVFSRIVLEVFLNKYTYIHTHAHTHKQTVQQTHNKLSHIFFLHNAKALFLTDFTFGLK